MKIYPIVKGLYTSARTAVLTPKEKKELIKKYALSAVVNLWHTKDSAIESMCEVYIHCPMSDGRRIDTERVDQTAAAINKLLDEEKNVLVHCYGGRNRAGLVCCTAMMQRYKISGDEAVDKFISARPNALVNKNFVAYLIGK